MSARANLCNLGYAALILLLLYISVYSVLSFSGQYRPWLVDLNGVNEYAWAPFGYYDAEHPWAGSIAARKTHAIVTGGWNNEFLWDIFYPIYLIDRSWIHRNKVSI